MDSDTSLETFVLAFDLGGTNIKARLFSYSDHVAVPQGPLVITPSVADSTEHAVLAAILSAGAQANSSDRDAQLAWVAAAACEPFDYTSGYFSEPGGKFQSLFEVPLRPILSAAFAAPVYFCDDLIAMATGLLYNEVALRERRTLVVSVGTTLSCALVQDATPSRPPDLCTAWAAALAAAHPRYSMENFSQYFLARFKNSPANIAEAAHKGSRSAIIAFDTFARDLGTALAPLVSDFAVSAIALTGAVAESADLIVPGLRQVLTNVEVLCPTDTQPSPLGAVLATHPQYEADQANSPSS